MDSILFQSINTTILLLFYLFILGVSCSTEQFQTFNTSDITYFVMNQIEGYIYSLASMRRLIVYIFAKFVTNFSKNSYTRPCEANFSLLGYRNSNFTKLKQGRNEVMGDHVELGASKKYGSVDPYICNCMQ